MPDNDLGVRLLSLVDDVLTERDMHGLEPRVARDLQLAAQAITQERFRRLAAELGRRLDRPLPASKAPPTS